MDKMVRVESEKQIVEPASGDDVVAVPVVTVAPTSDGHVAARGGITVEYTLYALIFLVALGLRFLALGTARPLLPLEATQAWAAWLDAMGRTAEALAVPQSPLLYSVQRFLFWMTAGGNDAWARVLPALVGSLLVLAPWGLRSHIGRSGALVLSLLLAIDPWLLAFSRLADGAILAVTTGMLLWVGLLNWNGGSTLQRRLLAVVAGLFVISGPLAWLLLPPLLWTLILNRPVWDGDRRQQTELLALSAGTVLLGATGWLTAWSGLGALSTSLSVAVSYLSGDSLYPLLWPFLRLWVDEPLLAVLGVAGLIVLFVAPRQSFQPPATSQRRWAYLLAGWVAYGLLLWLLPGRNPATLLVLGLPLLVAAAYLVARLLRFATHETDWQDGVLIAITLAVLLVTSGFLTASYSEQVGSDTFPWTALLFYLILPAAVIFFAWWSGWRTTAQIAALVVLGGFFLATASSSWTISLRSELLYGHQLYAVTSQPNVHMLAADVAKLSAIRAGDPTVAQVSVVVDDELRALLGWYLRSMRNLRFAGAIDPTQIDPTAMVISQPTDTLAVPAGSVGSDYPITSRWLPTQLEGWNARLRWVLFRELRERPAMQPVILWVQN